MSTIPSTDYSQGVGTAPRASTLSETAASEDRFLTLLVAQMENQDPLNPLDNAQVTSQLAQINTVKGIESTNAALADLGARFEAMQLMQSSSLVGKQVRAPSDAVTLASGAAGKHHIELSADTNKVEVRIVDASGKAVRTESLGGKDAGTFEYQWDGKTDDGTAARDGKYRIEIVAENADAVALVDTRVRSVDRTLGGWALALDNDTHVALGDLRRID